MSAARVFPIGLAAVGLIAGVSCARAQVASRNPAAVEAGTYKVEPLHTQIGFSISHFGFTDFAGLFGGAAGTLQLDPASPQLSHLTATVAVKSITTTVPILTERLKGGKWFDVARYPEATFTSTRIIRTGPRSATIDGDD